MRRCRGVAKLGPGSLQSWWTGEAIDALTDAHTEVQAAKARGQTALEASRLAKLRERYDKAVDSGIIHNRHRDWHGGRGELGSLVWYGRRGGNPGDARGEVPGDLPASR